MGKNDFCCVYGCSRQRNRAKQRWEVCSFYQIPLGKSSKAIQRRKLWLNALRRADFVPTKNSKVCDRHFVSGIAINDATSVDYIPTLHLGYKKKLKERTTSSSRKASYFTDEKLSSLHNRNEKAQLVGLVVPQPAAYVEIDSTCSLHQALSCE